ncbi:type III secretion protein [Proteus vulgaris]|uniref:type III secretion protein n=1 Tax=Proteus vulgaris TaxID=585 RepID=UPI00235E2ACA|nr:type III secretion protein [Proteus vulgaris]MDS0787841.1 type III secretion protein [Proteus vulgaris]
MLRSLPETLLSYTCEGVLIRSRYLRQLDNIHRIEQITHKKMKKRLIELEKKQELQSVENKKQAYAEGLQVLLGDILTLCTQYHTELCRHEIQQRELIVQEIAHYFQSPQMQIELTKHLITTVPTDTKLILEIPKTLRSYVEELLNGQDVELIFHNESTLSINSGSHVVFFDPPLFTQDLKKQFHQYYCEKNHMLFSQEVKMRLLAYIQEFDENTVDEGTHDEN